MKLHWFPSSLLSTAICVLLSAPALAARLQSWQFSSAENRLVFTTDVDVQPRAQLIPNPTRVVIDLPGIVTAGPTRSRSVGGSIREVRVGRLNAQTTRIVIELVAGYTLDPQQIRVRGLSPTQWTVQLPEPIRQETAPIAPPSIPAEEPAPSPPRPPQRDSSSRPSANPSLPVADTRLESVRVTQDGVFLRTRGQNPQSRWQREGDRRLILILDNTAIDPQLIQRDIRVGRHGVNRIQVEQGQGTPASVRLTLDLTDEMGDWRAIASPLGGVVLLPPRAARRSTSATASTAEDNTSEPAIVEAIEYDRDRGQLVIRSNRSIAFTSGWDRATAAYRITLPNAQFREQLENPRLAEGDPLLWIRLRQEQPNTVVVLVQPTAGVRVGSPAAPDRGEITLPLSRLGIGSRLPQWTPGSSLPDVALPEDVDSQFTIVLDPGHGGRDPGAIGINGLREVDIVNDIFPQVTSLLQERGIRVVLTRQDNRTVGLESRLQMTRQVNADVFVSIHANAISLSRPDVNGVETYYYSPGGRRLAEILQLNLLNATGMRDRGAKRARFYVLRNTAVPSALVEVGFVTGVEDAPRLASSEFRSQLARAIARGILQYLQERTMVAPPGS